MNASISNYGFPARSIFKSSKTKPLPKDSCNMPVNCPEDFREEIDETKDANESRNTFLLRAIIEGVKAMGNPAKALKLQNILDAHKLAAQLAACLALVCFVSLALGNPRKELARQTRTIRNVRKLHYRKDGESFFVEEFAA